MSSWRQNAFQSGGTTFHYRLQGPVISFWSTLWKQQNVIMFSGCFQHYIATIYFHFICLSNTGASSGNCFRLQGVSAHEKSSFSPPISWEPQWCTTLNGSLEQVRSPTFVKLFLSFFFFFLLEEAIRETGRLLWPLSHFPCLLQKWEEITGGLPVLEVSSNYWMCSSCEIGGWYCTRLKPACRY